MSRRRYVIRALVAGAATLVALGTPGEYLIFIGNSFLWASVVLALLAAWKRRARYDAAQLAVAADVILAYARVPAAERQYRSATKIHDL